MAYGWILLNISVDEERLTRLNVFIIYFRELFFSSAKDWIWAFSAVTNKAGSTADLLNVVNQANRVRVKFLGLLTRNTGIIICSSVHSILICYEHVTNDVQILQTAQN